MKSLTKLKECDQEATLAPAHAEILTNVNVSDVNRSIEMRIRTRLMRIRISLEENKKKTSHLPVPTVLNQFVPKYKSAQQYLEHFRTAAIPGQPIEKKYENKCLSRSANTKLHQEMEVNFEGVSLILKDWSDEILVILK